MQPLYVLQWFTGQGNIAVFTTLTLAQEYMYTWACAHCIACDQLLQGKIEWTHHGGQCYYGADVNGGLIEGIYIVELTPNPQVE